MPRAMPVMNRRGVLAGGVALAALGAAVSACTGPPPNPPAVEDLLAPLEQARGDSALAAAAAAAVGSPPQIAAALTVVASQRAAHAHALATEIARAAGKLVSTTNEASSPSPSPSPTEPAPPPPTVAEVIAALRASADSAGHLAVTSSGYRAGLLGSIAASCTASYTVALLPGGPSI